MPKLDRYGLENNPYRVKLDPLSTDNHGTWVARVDGFAKLKIIEDDLEKAVNQKQSRFFLVTGRSGTGRTCVANYILARYRDLRGIPPERFLVPPRNVNTHDEFITFKSWLIFLRTAINNLKPYIASMPTMLDEIKSADRDTMEAIFQGIVSEVDTKMSGAPEPTGFGCCLEDIPTSRFVHSALTIFSEAQTVCVFTAKDYEEWQKQVIEPLRQKMGSRVIIELSPFSGEQVKTLVEHRWQQVSEHPSPFDSAGLTEAFNNRQWPVGRALQIISQLLEMRHANHPQGDRWPHAPDLELSRDYLCDMLQTLLDEEYAQD